MKNFLTKTRGSYRLNSKEPKTRVHIIWILIAFFVLFFAKGIVSTTVSSVTNSLYTLRHYFQTSSATIPVFIRDRDELLAEIQKLEQEIATGEGMQTTLQYVTEENLELRALLSASSTPQIVAGVIARPPYVPYDTIIIDKGSEDGIVAHAPVYHGKGFALGYVRKVFPRTALITLFSSPNVQTTVYVYGANIFTTAYGEGGGVIHISVPQGILLEKGKTVILPSLDAGILGVIDEIQSIPTEPEQHAYVTLDTPLQSIRLVGVGRYPAEERTFAEAIENVEEMNTRLFQVEIPEAERVYDIQATTTGTTTPQTGTNSTSTQL